MAALPFSPVASSYSFAALERKASFAQMSSSSTIPSSVIKKPIHGSYDHLCDGDLVIEVASRGLGFLSYIGRRSPPAPAPFKWLAPFERKDLINELKRDDYISHPYLQFTNKDLARFIKNRGLSFPCLRNKSSMMAVLEEADANFTFPIMDLPPELRVKIYDYTMGNNNLPPVRLPKRYKPRKEPSFKHLPGHLSRRQQKKPDHPLTRVSRLIRQESLYSLEHLEKNLKRRKEAIDIE